MPDAQTETIAGAGHMPVVMRPDLFGDTVRQWLDAD